MAKRKTKKKRAAKRPAKKNISWRTTVKRTKKARRRLGLAEWDFPSRQKQLWKDKTRKPRKKKRNAGRKVAPAKVKLKPAKAGGWIKAEAVRFVKKGGRMTVLVRRKKARRK